MPIKILIVEEEAISAMDLKSKLENMGFEVVSTASRGKEAIQKAGELNPDVVLMDIVLKGEIDGIETATKINTLFDIPIIYLTAFADEETYERAKLTKPYGFLTKPLNHDALRGSVETTLYKHSLDKKLAESEERYRKIVETANEGILEMDIDHNIISVNSAMAKMLGYSIEEMIDSPIMNFLFNEDLNHHEERMKLFGEGIYDKYECKLKHKDGSTRWALISSAPQKNEKNQFTRLFTMFMDITGRKNTEEALKEQAVMLANVNDAVIGTDINYLINYWNSAAEGIYGYSAEEIMGKYAGILEPEFIGMSKEEALEQLESTGKLNIELFHTTKDGRKITIDSRNQLLYDENGKQYGNIGINRDITERKKSEEQLKESEARFHSLYENSFDAILLTKPDGSILAANPIAQEMFRMSEEEIIKVRIDGIMVNDEKLELALKEREEKGKIKAELTFKRNDSSIFPGEVTSSIFSDTGGDIKASMIIRDITERKKLEEHLRQTNYYLEEQVKERTAELEETYNIVKENEKKYRELVENARNIILKMDKKGNITFFNEYAEDFFSFEHKEILGKNVIGTIVPETESSGRDLKKMVDKILKNPNLHEYNENENITKHGKRVWISWSNKGIYKNDELISILSVGTDITKHKETEKKLDKLINELEHSNEELKQFAYISSHDLQEPLRTIASFTQLMQKRYAGKLDSDADEFMDYIVEASIRMKQQIQDLLDYSSSTNSKENIEIVDTNKILNQTIKNLNISIKESNAKITYDKLPAVMGDEGQLERIFYNLISNAIKFRKLEEPLKIHISAYKSEDGKKYVFSVKDNGIGIEKEYLERIFTIFQRLHTRDVYEGTGIGLSIVKRIIERHGGRVWVDSSFEVGSIFYFTVPIIN